MAEDILTKLDAVIAARLNLADPTPSYVASIAAKGVGGAARKLGEEATETIIAALDEGDAALVGEGADLLFHLAILLHLRGCSLGDVAAELAQRQGLSGHDEKAQRPQTKEPR